MNRIAAFARRSAIASTSTQVFTTGVSVSVMAWKNSSYGIAGAVAASVLLASCGFHHKKYDNPITKDTQQPDKVLYDKAIKDIEHSRFEVARLTLNTLINTYDSSEYLAKAKLAIADSWYREGGAHGLGQAEAEYKDFILFYPTMEESAEAQNKICMIHFKEMEKSDRDSTQAHRAETECRQLLQQFPNSKYAPQAEQKLREIQEVLADGEFKVGDFYHHKGANPAASNRFDYLVKQYPLYSGADEALWMQADSYSKMGPRFRQKAGDAYTKIVRDYPLSGYTENAKKKLKEMELPIPDPDPVAYARMKYELENRKKPGMVSRSLSIFSHGPDDLYKAAKSGTPAMTTERPPIPASVPIPAAEQQGGFNGDVTAQTVSDSSVLDSKPDARMSKQNGGQGTATSSSSGEAKPAPSSSQLQENQPPVTNHPMPKQKKKKAKKNKKKDQPKQQDAAANSSSGNAGK